eukprot:scaffold14497_cov57-Attheya_sp.AAC.2
MAHMFSTNRAVLLAGISGSQSEQLDLEHMSRCLPRATYKIVISLDNGAKKCKHSCDAQVKELFIESHAISVMDRCVVGSQRTRIATPSTAAVTTHAEGQVIHHQHGRSSPRLNLHGVGIFLPDEEMINQPNNAGLGC